MGIEPTQPAWKAGTLPLSYTRWKQSKLVEGGGFEPPKAEPSDLQSDPFDRSGTPPKLRRQLSSHLRQAVNYQHDIIFAAARSARSSPQRDRQQSGREASRRLCLRLP